MLTLEQSGEREAVWQPETLRDLLGGTDRPLAERDGVEDRSTTPREPTQLAVKHVAQTVIAVQPPGRTVRNPRYEVPYDALIRRSLPATHLRPRSCSGGAAAAHHRVRCEVRVWTSRPVRRHTPCGARVLLHRDQRPQPEQPARRFQEEVRGGAAVRAGGRGSRILRGKTGCRLGVGDRLSRHL